MLTRPLCFAAAALLSLSAVPSAAIAGPGGYKAPKAKKKGPSKSKGKGGKGKGGKGKGGKGKGVAAMIEGAGQRLAFSFGGRVALKTDGTAKGRFMLTAHPLSPSGSTLTVTCIYSEFSEVSIANNTATFRANGRCRRLNVDGTISRFDAQNQFQIVDNDAGDLIDVNFIGGSGIAVPAGALSFGDFTFTL